MPAEPILVIAVGGTIDKTYRPQSAQLQVGPPAAERIPRRVTLAMEVRVTSLIRKDSLDFTAEDREMLCRAVAECPEGALW
jgi:L-asparaginase